MRRYFRWDKKYLYWGITAFCVIALCVSFYMALNNFSVLVKAAKALVGILSPFIWGLIVYVFGFTGLSGLILVIPKLFKKMGNAICKKAA